MFLPSLTQCECHKVYRPIKARQHIEINLVKRYASMKNLLCEDEGWVTKHGRRRMAPDMFRCRRMLVATPRAFLLHDDELVFMNSASSAATNRCRSFHQKAGV